MTRAIGVLTVLVFTSFGFACEGEGLKTKDTDASTAGGAGGTLASGGATGFAGAGGTTLGKGGANTGGSTNLGKGGANAGGSATGGKGGFSGSTCPLIMCPAVACLNGTLPNPDPCGCPICAPPPDAGTVADARPDACIALPCAYPLCAPGYITDTPACGCPRCVPIDGGQPDVSRDTASDAAKSACAGLDECSCAKTAGCSPITESCYCPFPTCGSGACICGGGRFVGCVADGLSTCAAAKARVSALCPTLKGTTYDGLCQQADGLCITKCLNDVTVCSDIACTACDTCDCAGDKFSACVADCKKTLKQ